ncbi:MAG: hypothetical protein AAGE76_06695 [Pseudomonadota bacterium]
MTPARARPDWQARIAADLAAPVPGPVAAMAAHLAARDGVVAVLFYGNVLRSGDAGLMDFYVLVEDYARYHGAGLAARANRALPPNVYHEVLGETAAKVAVISRTQFRNRMLCRSRDTTTWARFCQPARLVWVRDAGLRRLIEGLIAEAYRTAAWWAARLAPADADPRAAWQALFRATYGAELRVESGDRAEQIVTAGWSTYGPTSDALMATPVSGAERAVARRKWAAARRRGKLLNFLRLLKAAATYRGGIDYALSKVERHTGAPAPMSGLARRLPWLAAPVIFIRLILQRRLR